MAAPSPDRWLAETMLRIRGDSEALIVRARETCEQSREAVEHAKASVEYVRCERAHRKLTRLPQV